jgi:predicted nuclease of predicted toxin-antitoxin system
VDEQKMIMAAKDKDGIDPSRVLGSPKWAQIIYIRSGAWANENMQSIFLDQH